MAVYRMRKIIYRFLWLSWRTMGAWGHETWLWWQTGTTHFCWVCSERNVVYFAFSRFVYVFGFPLYFVWIEFFIPNFLPTAHERHEQCVCVGAFCVFWVCVHSVHLGNFISGIGIVHALLAFSDTIWWMLSVVLIRCSLRRYKMTQWMWWLQ